MTDTIERPATRPAFAGVTIRGRMSMNGVDAPASPAIRLESTAVIVSGVAAVPSATFEDILARHQTEIFRFALQLTRDRTEADDLYQETMIKAYRAFGRLNGAANHRAWLYKIASNTFLSDRRKRGRIDSLDEQTSVIIADEEIDHAASLDARALLIEVAAYVERLPAKQRIALVLRKYHGLGYDEIATTLACSEAAARANVHQALRKLRDCFGDRL
ncbi:MAG: RNA polymerase sigma factor [Thermomicrobiales bacterium]